MQNLDTLKAGNKVDLPLWMALALAKRDIVELKSPKYLTEGFFDTLKAGSEVVSMRLLNPYLYENVMKLATHLDHTKSKESIELYQKCFIERFKNIVIALSSNAN